MYESQDTAPQPNYRGLPFEIVCLVSPIHSHHQDIAADERERGVQPAICIAHTAVRVSTHRIAHQGSGSAANGAMRDTCLFPAGALASC